MVFSQFDYICSFMFFHFIVRSLISFAVILHVCISYSVVFCYVSLLKVRVLVMFPLLILRDERKLAIAKFMLLSAFRYISSGSLLEFALEYTSD